VSDHDPISFTLPDRRTITYRDLGDTDGTPVLHAHGWPGSSAEVLSLHPVAASRGVRLVAVDRPGFGGSEPVPGRSVLSWVDDAITLADALTLGRFGVLASSGGASYALACAAVAPSRITAVALACPLGPLRRGDVRAALPWRIRGLLPLFPRESLVRACLVPLRLVVRRPPESPWLRLALAFQRRLKPPSDRRVLDRPEVREARLRASREAFGAGVAGPASDLHLITSDWGFDPARVTTPVRIWYGRRDSTIPCAVGSRLEEAIPTASAVYDPDGGHTSTLEDHAPAVLDWLRAAPGASTGLARPVRGGR